MSVRFLTKLTSLGIGQNQDPSFSLWTSRRLLTDSSTMLEYDRFQGSTNVTENTISSSDHPQDVISEQHEMLDNTPVRRDKTILELMNGSQRRLDNVLVKTFTGFRQRTLSVQSRFQVDVHGLQDFIDKLDVSRMTIKAVRPFFRFELSYVLDESASNIEDSDSRSIDPQQHQRPEENQRQLLQRQYSTPILKTKHSDLRGTVSTTALILIMHSTDSTEDKISSSFIHPRDINSERREDLNDALVRRNESFLELTITFQGHLRDALMKMFKNLRHHVLCIQFHFEVNAHALQDLVHILDVSTTTIKTNCPFSRHDEGIMRSPSQNPVWKG